MCAETTRRFGPYTVELGNLDKELYPGGATKRDVIGYYEAVAGRILPHLDDRPLTLRRFPDGIEREGFYQKRSGDYFPDWIDTVRVDSNEGPLDQVVCGNQATLVYLANQAAIELHPWLSRRPDLDRPDLAIFDLDPGESQSFADVRKAARLLHELLDELGLTAYLKATGSRGLHVLIPLRPSAGFDEVRRFAGDIAETLAERHPDLLTTAVRKDSRKGRLFVDTLRNAYAQTAVAPYSLRARPGAPVAMPLPWDALHDNIGPQPVTIANIDSWLDRKDPWEGMGRHRQDLESRCKQLEQLRGEAKSNGAKDD